MAEITASLVKELREKTGAGMMDCKKALTETSGDLEGAVDWLRKKGLSAAAKKSGRVAAEGLMRARCMAVPVDPETALCRVLGQWKMYVDLRDTGFAPHLMLEGYWEYWITDFVWRNVKPGQVALDLGANHGYYTLLLADLVGPGGRVHAFEPNPRLLELLRRNIALNGFWRVAEAREEAVGDGAGAPVVGPQPRLGIGFRQIFQDRQRVIDGQVAVDQHRDLAGRRIPQDLGLGFRLAQGNGDLVEGHADLLQRQPGSQ